MKTGAKHLESLRDGREVYIRGERVADVTAHPAFRNSVQSAAHLYDFQSEHPEEMTFVSPETSDPREPVLAASFQLRGAGDTA